VVATVLAIFIIGVGAIFLYRSGYFVHRSTTTFEKIKISRATNEGNVESVAVSPDGKYLAYTTVEGTTHALWTKHLATGSRVQIAVPPGAGDLMAGAFTPDGNYVLFGVNQPPNPGFDLYQVPVLGGQSKRLISKVSPNISFSPDGKEIAFDRIDYQNEEEAEAVMIANADGSNERKITSRQLPEEIGFHGVSWSPDGKTLMADYWDRDQNPFLAQIDVADGSVNLVSDKKFDIIESIKWLPSGAGLIFGAQEHASEPGKVWYAPRSHLDSPRIITVDLNRYGTEAFRRPPTVRPSSSCRVRPIPRFMSPMQLTSGRQSAPQIEQEQMTGRRV
jgi:dipeptidyl aminopeptidase/acylaminoacyl peptidase